MHSVNRNTYIRTWHWQKRGYDWSYRTAAGNVRAHIIRLAWDIVLPYIDYALSKIDAVNEFLMQDVYEKAGFEDTVSKLEALFD